MSNIDLKTLAPNFSCFDVKDQLLPGGGFIFGSTNSVQFGEKTDNYLKAIETVRKYGLYT